MLLFAEACVINTRDRREAKLLIALSLHLSFTSNLKFFSCFSPQQICLIVHYLYDDNMAALLCVSKQGVRDTPELHAWLPHTDIVVRRLDHIHQLLQDLHDDVLECLCAVVHTVVSKLALLRRHIAECSGKFLDLHHLHNLHLYSDTAEALSMLHPSASLFNSF